MSLPIGGGVLAVKLQDRLTMETSSIDEVLAPSIKEVRPTLKYPSAPIRRRGKEVVPSTAKSSVRIHRPQESQQPSPGVFYCKLPRFLAIFRRPLCIDKRRPWE